MVSSGLLRRVALVRADVSEEPGASFTRVTKIGEVGTTQAATSNRRTLQRNTKFLRSVRRLLGGARFLRNVGSYKSHTAQQPRRHHSTTVFSSVSVNWKGTLR
jgi:hypothetical protein